MIYLLTKNTSNTYIFRLYPEERSLRYVFAMPVSYRGKGEWEAHAWNSMKKLWPEAPLQVFSGCLVWLIEELTRVEPKFKKLIGTFEKDRLSAYRRLFRSGLEIEKLRKYSQRFNGCTFDGYVVEFKKVGK